MAPVALSCQLACLKSLPVPDDRSGLGQLPGQLSCARADLELNLSWAAGCSGGWGGAWDYDKTNAARLANWKSCIPVVGPCAASGKREIVAVATTQKKREKEKLLLPRPWNGERNCVWSSFVRHLHNKPCVWNCDCDFDCFCYGYYYSSFPAPESLSSGAWNCCLPLRLGLKIRGGLRSGGRRQETGGSGHIDPKNLCLSQSLGQSGKHKFSYDMRTASKHPHINKS